MMERKIALLTGASKGIGYATAQMMAKKGYELIINSRNTSGAVKKLQENGTIVEGVDGSLGDAATITALIAKVEERGQIDALLLNHGGPPVKSFIEVSHTEWETFTKIMLHGPLRLLRELIPIMQRQQKCRVAAISSFTVKSPYPGIVLSNSLRAALVNALKTAAIELGGDGILINTVAPGYIATQRVLDFNQRYADKENISKEEVDQRTIKEIPLKRFGKPEDVAGLVAYLLSEENQYITGQNIHVDGGLITAN